ncbi:DUF222 domain-containing protein [Kribbella sp. NPDC051587]|uniref:HNH endonuclease signature motif containing protein n=1 Tax=Kribbella sp. NPDC051587 TaxID=3364119 RepID=UPI003799627E
MENLAMAPVWSQSGSELLTTLDNLYAAKSLIETYILQATARLDDMGTAQELGARDTVELVSQRYRLDPAVVRKDLKFSGALGKYPAVTDALPDPTDPAHPAVLDPALAKVIVTTLEKAPASVPVDVLEVAEEQMVEVARISNPRELAKFGQEVLARLDTDGAEPAEDEALAKETFRLRQVDGGVRFSGFVAGASGELLLTQIHTGAKPHKTVDGERDPRPLDVRQVDSFKGVLDAAAGNPDHPGVPHITVTIDFNDLKAALLTNTPEAFRAGDTESGGAGAVGEMVLGGNLSASAVRLLACDAAILPIVLGGDSQPLDVGTEQRFVNRYLRRALNKRDKGCVVCKAPPWMCHAHHIIYWADGGPTSLQNLVLLCAAHHRAVHAGQWAVSITGGLVQVTRPGWADPPPRTSPTALADLAAVIGWATPASSASPDGVTPAHNAAADGLAADPGRPRAAGDGGAGGFTPGGDVGGDGFGPARSSGFWGVDGLTPADSGGAGGLSADRMGGGVSSNPVYEQATRLPAASRLPSPEVAAAREAFRTRLRAMVPDFTDPWATDTAPATGP